MNVTRRNFLTKVGAGILGFAGLSVGVTQAGDSCQRISGFGSYLLGPFESLTDANDVVYLVTDLGFDETSLFCTVRTNYAPFRFPTAQMGIVDLEIHEFFMDMQSVQIDTLDVVDTGDGLQAVYSGVMRSETRVFSGDRMQTFIEGDIGFGCHATHLNDASKIEISTTNFSMTANFEPEGEHAAIFGEHATFAGRLSRGNIVVQA